LTDVSAVAGALVQGDEKTRRKVIAVLDRTRNFVNLSRVVTLKVWLLQKCHPRRKGARIVDRHQCLHCCP
jgi:hypothetical protein